MILIGDTIEGLEYLHKQGVLHLNIKEDNILVFVNNGFIPFLFYLFIIHKLIDSKKGVY